MSQPESSVCGFPLPQRPVVVASSACDFLRVLSGYSGNDRPLFVLGHVDHRPKADCRAGMAGRPNMFSHQNPNMANVNVGRAPSHRDRMLEERRLQRKVQPTVLQANTYEGRRAQEEQYKQQVEEERKKLAFQRQQQDEMKRQSRQQPPPMDFAAKAATNARVDDARAAKAKRDAIFEEKRRANMERRRRGGGGGGGGMGKPLPVSVGDAGPSAAGPSLFRATPNSNMVQNQPMQQGMQMQPRQVPMQENFNHASMAPNQAAPRQELQRQPQRQAPVQPRANAANPMNGGMPLDNARRVELQRQSEYAAGLQQQIIEKKQLELQNDHAIQPTSNMNFGANHVNPIGGADGNANPRRAAKQEYATELRQQMAMQEEMKAQQRAQEKRDAGNVYNNGSYFGGNMQPSSGIRGGQYSKALDPAAQESMQRKAQYKAELDAQLRAKQKSELRQVGRNGGHTDGSLVFGGNRQPINGQRGGPAHQDPSVQLEMQRKAQYKAELDAQLRAKQQAELAQARRGAGGEIGGGMGLGMNHQPLDGRRHRGGRGGGGVGNMYSGDADVQERMEKKQREKAYLDDLANQVKMKEDRKRMEKMQLQEEEQRHMAKAAVGIQPISNGPQGPFAPPGNANNRQRELHGQSPMRMNDYQPRSVQQVGPGPVYPAQGTGRPQQPIGTGQPLPTNMPGVAGYGGTLPEWQGQRGAVQAQGAGSLYGPGGAADRVLYGGEMNRNVALNQEDHLSRVMNERANNVSTTAQQHRFRDGIKDPAEVEALQRKHEQAMRQGNTLAQQVEERRLAKEAAKRKQKEDDAREEARLERERLELKKAYDDEVKSKRLEREAKQKAELDAQIAARQKIKEMEAAKERERARKEDERIAKDRAEMAEKYERETGRSPPKKGSTPLKGGPPGTNGAGLERSPPPRSSGRPPRSRAPPSTVSVLPRTEQSPTVHDGRQHLTAEQKRIQELEAQLALQQGGGSRPRPDIYGPSGDRGDGPARIGTAPVPMTPPPRTGGDFGRGNDTVRREQQSLLRKHDNMREQMEKQMRLLKEMQVKLDVREAESAKYQQELAKLKGMVQEEKSRNSKNYLDDFTHAQEKDLHSQIDEELTRLLEGGPATPKAFRGKPENFKTSGDDSLLNLNASLNMSPIKFSQSPSPRRSNGPDALDNYMALEGGNRHSSVNESMSSSSKFVFPDGHSAPAPNVSLSARTPARNPSPAKSKLRSSPIGLGGDVGMLSDGQSVMDDSINIDMLMNKNASKLSQLEQLDSHGLSGGNTSDQLDQMLVDFLGRNNSKTGDMDIPSFASPSRSNNHSRAAMGIPKLKIQNYDQDLSSSYNKGEDFGGSTLQAESRFIGTMGDISAR